MSREEVIDLLEILAAAYPNARLGNPKRTADAWMLAFAEADAGDIYKAARHHMTSSPYFPTIADIEKARKYTFRYQAPADMPAIEDKNKPLAISDGKDYMEIHDDFLADLGFDIGDDE